MLPLVINLPHRTDRLANFLESYEASGWRRVLGQPLIVEAIDGRHVPRDGLWAEFGPGTYGCHLSHLLALDGAMRAGADQVFVFEDDAVFLPNSAQRLVDFLDAVPSRDALWLGGQSFGRRTNVRANVRLPDATFRTHAYALSGEVIWKIFDDLFRSVGHLDASYHELLKKADVKVYSPNPWLVGQGASYSDISGQHESERWWLL